MEKEGLMVLEEDQKVILLVGNDFRRMKCNECPEQIELHAHLYLAVQVFTN